MRIHQIEAENCNYQGCISRDRRPILTVESGDNVVCRTPCSIWLDDLPRDPDGELEVLAPPLREDPANDTGHCLVGPIAMKGAKPGMTLQVSIRDMQTETYGFSWLGGADKTYASPLDAALGVGKTPTTMRWKIFLRERMAKNAYGHEVALRPFMGFLGVAPDLPGILSTRPPHSCGGNIDCKDLVSGSIIYFPIQVPGALFSLGDGHAAQGDGEIGGSGIECPMRRISFQMVLRNDMPIRSVCAQTPLGWIFLGFGKDLDEAMIDAANCAVDHIEREYSLSRPEAVCMASAAVDFRVTQVVNETVGVTAFLRKDGIRVR